MKYQDQGMTILEVVIAITIFLIGVGFIAQSNAVALRYRARQEVRQQMIFYAAGQLEAALEKADMTKNDSLPPPINNFQTTIKKTPMDEQMQDPEYWINGLPNVQEIDVNISSVTYSDITPVTMKTYRVWTNP